MGSLLEETVMGFLDFGRMTASKFAETTKSLLATVTGNENDEGELEEAEEQEVWGHAAILWRPADATNSGECECILIRRGEDRLAIASRDVRWQVDDLEAGDVLFRSFGDNAATLRLKADGSVVVVAAGDILLGTDTAAKALALAEETKAALDDLQNAHDTHIHPTTATVSTGSAGVIGSPTVTVGTIGAIASTKVKASE